MSRKHRVLSLIKISLRLGSHAEQKHSESRSAHFLPLAPVCHVIKISSKLLLKYIHPYGHKHSGTTVLKLIITLITVMAFVLSRSERGTKAAVPHTLSLVAKLILEAILPVLSHWLSLKQIKCVLKQQGFCHLKYTVLILSFNSIRAHFPRYPKLKGRVFDSHNPWVKDTAIFSNKGLNIEPLCHSLSDKTLGQTGKIPAMGSFKSRFDSHQLWKLQFYLIQALQKRSDWTTSWNPFQSSFFTNSIYKALWCYAARKIKSLAMVAVQLRYWGPYAVTDKQLDIRLISQMSAVP